MAGPIFDGPGQAGDPWFRSTLTFRSTLRILNFFRHGGLHIEYIRPFGGHIRLFGGGFLVFHQIHLVEFILQ